MSLNDADREALLGLLDGRKLLAKMAVGHVQAISKGDNEDEDPFSFPPRPNRGSEQGNDAFAFPESP